MENNEMMALDWGSEISKESEFELLPEGTYDFTVTAVERARYAGSEKMSACPQANITLKCKDTATGKEGNVFDTLYLHQKSEWKLSEFFTAIGQKKKGEPLKMNWNLVPGSTGKVEITVNKYKNKDGQERENNRVGKYLPKESSKAFVPGQF